jgi:hypothetical protein
MDGIAGGGKGTAIGSRFRVNVAGCVAGSAAGVKPASLSSSLPGSDSPKAWKIA